MKRRKQWLAFLIAACMAVPAAVSGMEAYAVQTAEAAEDNLIVERSEVAVTQGSAEDLSAYADEITSLDSATIVVKYTSTSSYAIQSLFSISNNTAGNKDRHFHIYITPAGRLGCEIRNTNGVFNYHFYADAVLKAGKENVIAFKADRANGQYKMFANGLLVKTINASDLAGGYKFAADITGANNVQLGATNRAGVQQYTFGGTIHSAEVYGAALDDAVIMEKVYTDGIDMGAAISTMFDASLRDNTWVFVGGAAVRGGFDQTRGIRNYIGQFEEYIRWTIGGSSPINGRQRFTFNIGKDGRTLSEIVENYDTLVAAYKTKAAVYMVGAEDYSQGEEKLAQFKEDLGSFIEKSLALKDGNGFAVIQKPFAVKDAAANALIRKYCEAVDEVTESYQTDLGKYSRIVVADHFEATNTADFKENKLQEDDTLNAQGHLEIGRQLALATCGVSGDFPRSGVSLNLAEEELPEEYLKVQPEVLATDSSLKVEIPVLEGTEWKYELKLSDVTVKGTAASNSFEITGLAKHSDYVLKLWSADGTRQLVTVMGTVKAGEKAVKNAQALDVDQQKIADLAAGEEPVTWLFMGDSITHACQFTFGYDGIAQIFDKFVKDELGRMDDIVLNTAVSNANTDTTLQEIDQRLENYQPDVISIMIGTNDCVQRVGINVQKYETNMIAIIEKMKAVNPDAVIILRSPAPVFDAERVPTVGSYINVLKKLANDYDLIYVDQFTEWSEATTVYSAWLKSALFPDGLHPNANGHRIMANMFLKATGLWTEDCATTNLFYDMGITETVSNVVPELFVSEGEIGVNIAELKKAGGLSLGNVIMKVTSQLTGQSYEINVKPGEDYAVIKNLPGGAAYEVEVSAYLTNAARKVTFALQEVTIERYGVVRIAGKTRYETGYKVADELKAALGTDRFEAVVIATGRSFADALAGSYLAVERCAPILLTNGKEDNITQLHEYIKANVAEGGTVYILGGEAAVPEAAEMIDGYDVVRLSGRSRYDTNLEILKEAGITGDSIIVATGKAFADSLSASAAKLPILLVKPGAALSDAQKDIVNGMKNIYIIGGEGAVSADIEAELAAYGKITRLSGRSRYETSVKAAETFFENAEEAVAASGKNFPDGLCGGPLAAALNAPLILTADGKTEAAGDYLTVKSIDSGCVLGGSGALSDEAVTAVFALKDAGDIILK